jgi:predicted phage terminase large subunit-like protein
MLVLHTATVDGRKVKIFMEEEGGASGKSLIEHYARTVLGGYSFAGDRPTGDKITRTLPLAAAAEAGNVLLLEGAWNKIFLDEVEQFGPDAIHDDMVDACAGALNKITGRRMINPHVGSETRPDEQAIQNIERYADILGKASTPEERDELERIIREEAVAV